MEKTVGNIVNLSAKEGKEILVSVAQVLENTTQD